MPLSSSRPPSSEALVEAAALADLGSLLRRRRHRSAAREPLSSAIERATRCGATGVAERARAELLATGSRPRRTLCEERDALAPSEQRVAALAAQGRTYRGIAAELFITPKTVEAHLRSVYRKLGINGRDGLAAALSA